MTSNGAGDQISNETQLVSDSVQAAGTAGSHDRHSEAPIVSLDSQILFLKQCHNAAALGFSKAKEKGRLDQAIRALTHLEATIRVLEELRG